MEQWQETHILRNLPELIQTTVCNVTFLGKLQSNDVLSSSDIQTVNSKPTNDEKADTLYRLLIQRTHAYEATAKALLENRQHGAYQILLQGSPYTQEDMLSQIKVVFLGGEQSLGALLTGDEIRKLAGNLKNVCNPELLIFPNSTNEALPVLKGTVPEAESIYLSRWLSKRVQLNEQIFSVRCPDIFLFTEITGAELTKLARKYDCGTSTSGKQIKRISKRFILLEELDHWKYLCQIAGNAPLHLIRYECAKEERTDALEPRQERISFILERTTGGSKFINEFLNRETGLADELSIHEDKFIEQVASQSGSGVCICDLPGMGKSLLLANLARTTLRTHPEKVITFIPLSQLSQYIAASNLTNRENADWDILAIANFMCPTLVSAQILLVLLLTRKYPLELFLDGLDEVHGNNMKHIENCLRNLSKKRDFIRVHVTSRPNSRHILERATGTLPFDILPFDEDTKIEYLTRYWKKLDGRCNEKKLKEYAIYCLKYWQKKLSKDDVGITGIPLQCRLLAAVNAIYAIRYALTNTPLENFKVVGGSLTELYQSYISRGYTRVENDLGEDYVLIDKIKRYHEWKAIQVLFPELQELYQKAYSVGTSLEKSDSHVMSAGILKQVFNGNKISVDFIHRTFAEFTAAAIFASIILDDTNEHFEEKATFGEKYISDFLKKEIEGCTNHQFLFVNNLSDPLKTFNTKMYAFQNSVILKFLDDLLEEKVSSSPVQIHNKILQAFELLAPELVYSMISGCMYGNFVNILKVIILLMSKSSETCRTKHQSFLLSLVKSDHIFTWAQVLLYLAAQRTNSTVAELVETELLEGLLSFDLDNLHSTTPTGYLTPLHLAIRSGEYEQVELILRRVISIAGKRLLYWTMEGTHKDGAELILKKIEIWKILWGKDPNILLEENVRHGKDKQELLLYLLSIQSHVEFIKFLILKKETTYGELDLKAFENIVSGAAAYMNPHQFHEMLPLINPARINSGITSDNLLSKLRYVLTHFRHIKPKTFGEMLNNDTVQLVGIESVTTLLQTAVAANQRVDLLQQLIQLGGDPREKDEFGWNLLHVAAAFRNLNATRFCLKEGLSMREETRDGNTALHYMLDITPHFGEQRKKRSHMPDSHFTSWEYVERCQGIIKEVAAGDQTPPAAWKSTNKVGVTPIQLYLQGEIELPAEQFQSLLTSLGPINSIRDPDGNSLLMCAVQGKKSVTTLQALIQHGVAENLRNNEGQGVLHVAALSNNLPAVTFFFHRNGDATVADSKGKTPLALAQEKLAEFSKRSDCKLEREKQSQIVKLLKNSEGSVFQNASLICGCQQF